MIIGYLIDTLMINRQNNKRVGFFRKSKASNKELVDLFKRIQKIRYESNEDEWKDKKFITKLSSLEKKASQKILHLLKNKKLKTADDFYRAAFVFHHGENFEMYLKAVALAAISNHLGEPWGKNMYAVALDRLMVSIGLPQYFGSQYEIKKGKWQLFPVNETTTDEERRLYLIEPIAKLREPKRSIATSDEKKL